MDNALAAQALLALHGPLHALLPDLIKLEELLRTSVALNQGSELSVLLCQRQQQCVAAVALLHGLPAGAAGREIEGLHALLAAKPFIESSAAMIKDVQNLLAVLAGPAAPPELVQQPSLGTTESSWRRVGVQLAPSFQFSREAAPHGAPADTPGGSVEVTAGGNQTRQQQAQQQQQGPPAQAPAPAEQPAPLGLALLMQQERQDQTAMPPPSPAPWAKAAGGAGLPPAHQPPMAQEGAALQRHGQGDMAPAQPAPLAAELLFSPSIEMLPVLPSTGVLPTLSQLLEEPMLGLSIQDDRFVGAAAAAAAAAVGADGAHAGGGHAAQQATQPDQGNSAWPLLPLPSGQEDSLTLVHELLQPVQETRKPASSPAAAPVNAAGPAGLGEQGAPDLPLQQQHTPQPAPVGGVSNGSGGGAADRPQSPGGSLSYRRVSFAPLHSGSRTGLDQAAAAPLTRAASTSSTPFVARPLAAAPTPLPFLAGPPASLPMPGEPQAGGAAAAPVALPAAGQPASAAPPTAAPSRLAVVQAHTQVRIAQSAAAPAASPEAEQPKHVHSTAGTAHGPISYVSVQEAPPHDFSRGEHSLTRLFATVKATGILPGPTIVEGEEGEGSGSGASHSGHSSSGDASSESGQDSQPGGSTHADCSSGTAPQAPVPAAQGITTRQTRQSARLAQQQAAGADAGVANQCGELPAELGGTKRHKVL